MAVDVRPRGDNDGPLGRHKADPGNIEAHAGAGISKKPARDLTKRQSSYSIRYGTRNRWQLIDERGLKPKAIATGWSKDELLAYFNVGKQHSVDVYSKDDTFQSTALVGELDLPCVEVFR